MSLPPHTAAASVTRAQPQDTLPAAALAAAAAAAVALFVVDETSPVAV